MIPQNFRRFAQSFASMKSLLVAFLALGLFWFYVMAAPWLAFLNSDGAVPFQLVIEPWLPQDLFYWQTSRMGMLYEVIWKAGLSLLGIRESVVGSTLHAELFYLGHMLVVFIGFPFWLQTLESRFGKWLFFIFFVPMTHFSFEYYLTPGQPYGVVFALNGMFYWTLLRAAASSRKQIVLGSLLGAMFIQHELAFLILIGVYLSQSIRRPRDLFRRDHLLTGSILAVVMAIGFYFKARSREWDPGAHYRMTDVTSFLTLLGETIAQGRWSYDIRRGTGHILTLASIVYLISLIRAQRQKFFLRDVEQTTFVGALVGFVIIHLSRWFAKNGCDPRYFINLHPLFIWAFIRALESMPRKKITLQKCVYLAACLIPLWTHQNYQEWLNPLVRSQLTVSADPHQDYSQMRVLQCPPETFELAATPEQRQSLLFRLSPSWQAEACRLLTREHILGLSKAVMDEGCAGYIDDYWNSHILAVGSAGQVTASAGTHVRNPVLMGRILASRPLCVMVREPALQEYVFDLSCKKSARGFFVCKDAVK